MYAKGEGVQLSYEDAFAWFTEAANGGNADAQFELGRMYLSGIGIEKSEKIGIEWLKKSANGGNLKAKVLLDSR